MKTLKAIFIIIAIFGMAGFVHAQIKVDANDNVIG